MRKLYNEFFYIPKHGKVREKVMLARLASTITIVIMCLAAMSFTAYAYFSYNVTSGSNIIKAAHFETNVSIQITDSNGEAVEVITSNYISHTAELKKNIEYYITLKHTDRSTVKTGFVIITANNCDNRYHTQQLGKDGDGNTETVKFWLKPSSDTKVTFYSHWGTSSFYPDFMEIGENSELYILNNEHVALPITGTTNNDPPAGNTEDKDATSQPTTETTAPPEQTTPPATETTAPPEQTTPPATTEPSESTSATESSAPVTPTEPAVTEPAASEPTDTTESTEANI